MAGKRVESADVLSPSDREVEATEVEATEVFRRRAGKIRECRGSGARFPRSSVFILVFRRAASHHSPSVQRRKKQNLHRTANLALCLQPPVYKKKQNSWGFSFLLTLMPWELPCIWTVVKKKRAEPTPDWVGVVNNLEEISCRPFVTSQSLSIGTNTLWREQTVDFYLIL